MNPLAYISLGALVVAILVSCFTELNVGILSLALAYIVGVFLGGMKLDDVMRGFPVSTPPNCFCNAGSRSRG